MLAASTGPAINVATLDASLRFGIARQLQGIPQRLRAHLAPPPGRERALALPCELRQLDEIDGLCVNAAAHRTPFPRNGSSDS